MMKMKKILIYTGSLLLIIWGITHILPVKNVVRGFGDITADNIRILTMEWINEGFTLIFLGLLNIVVTVLKNNQNRVAEGVYLLTFIMLTSMSVLSLFTGFKVDFLPYKLCPLIFLVSGLMILLGGIYREKQ
jgi:hypothetical protein